MAITDRVCSGCGWSYATEESEPTAEGIEENVEEDCPNQASRKPSMDTLRSLKRSVLWLLLSRMILGLGVLILLVGFGLLALLVGLFR